MTIASRALSRWLSLIGSARVMEQASILRLLLTVVAIPFILLSHWIVYTEAVLFSGMGLWLHRVFPHASWWVVGIGGHGLGGVMGIYPQRVIGYAAAGTITVVTFQLMLILFLVSLRRGATLPEPPGKPSRLSDAIFGLLAAMLTTAVVALGLEWAGLWTPQSSAGWQHAITGTALEKYVFLSGPSGACLTVMILSWTLWSIWLHRMRLGLDRFTRLWWTSGALLLIAGALMIVSAINLDIHARAAFSAHGSGRQYFEHGSYTAMILAMGVALWTIIPLGILIGRLPRYHRMRHGLCLNCGYDLRSNAGECPECGQVASSDTRAIAT